MTFSRESFLVRLAYPNGAPTSVSLWGFLGEVTATLLLLVLFWLIVGLILSVVGLVVSVVMYGGAPIALFFGYRPVGMYRWFTSPYGLEFFSMFKRMEVRRSLYDMVTEPRPTPAWISRIKVTIGPTITFR